jgi:D-alanyl-D-alanine carboxypeptidase (penicillin-binding protein 5/6)
MACAPVRCPQRRRRRSRPRCARQYILIDLASNQVLAEREADAQADPASLTKLMTAYLVFNALRDKKLTLEQTLPVSQRAWAERKGGGSLMFIDTTMTPKVDELLRGMIVQSGNDASVALAEGVAARWRRLRRHDEPPGPGLGPEEHAVQERHRPDRARPLQQRARRGDHRRAHHQRAPRALPAVRDARLHLQQHQAGQPQHAAGPRPGGRRHEDRLHRRRRLLPGGQRARDTPGGKRRLLSVVLGTASARGARRREPEAAELGLAGLGRGAPVRGRQGGGHVPVWKGDARGAPGRAGRRCSSPCPRAKATS